jgi:SAM-dependent methyltransferase
MKFEYKDLDKEGLSILDTISAADKFNKWMYETIVFFCSGTILEIGSGTGNISQYFILNNKNIFLSDIRLKYRDILKSKFNLDDTRVFNIDVIHSDFCNSNSELLGKFDSIFCLNVIEHIKDDNLAIENIMKLLKVGGKLTVLVPAFQLLYNGIDTTLQHYKRYNKKTLIKLMSRHGSLIKIFYFNSIGILSWYISGKLLKNTTISKGKMSLFNFFVPVYKLVDKLLFQKIGLSVVCVIKKTI